MIIPHSCFEKMAIGDIVCISCAADGMMTFNDYSQIAYVGLFPLLERRNGCWMVHSQFSGEMGAVSPRAIVRIIKKKR